MDAIVAVYADWGIGRDGTQPLALSADRKHFRALTGQGTVILGRRTLEDFPGGRPLKSRRNIVLTRRPGGIEGAETAESVEAALALASGDAPCFVIGGQSVYRALLPYCERAFVTKIGACPLSDVFFPDLDRDPAWRLEEEGPELEEAGVLYKFAIYARKKD